MNNPTALALANETTKYDENATPKDAGVEPQQLAMGPVPVPKQKPTLAQFRDACDAFNIRGTCRLVGYELVTYYRPGGAVFPSVATLADGLGLKPRMVRYHLAHLERVGLWVRHGRTGTTNTYELRLPGGVQPIAGGGCNGLHPEVTNEVTTYVPAVVVSTSRQQQQLPRRTETRIEGLFAACAVRARQLGFTYDEADERARLREGETNLGNIQALADRLADDLAQRYRARAVHRTSSPHEGLHNAHYRTRTPTTGRFT